MTTDDLDLNSLRPRLCHLRRWPDFSGYGFNLHSEKSKQGQYIGKVDPNSPASSAGLRENDRIVEVNFVPIGNENHKQVVDRIKEGVIRDGTRYPEEVILLVLDPKTDNHYKSQSIVVTSSDSNVIKLDTQSQDGTKNGDRPLKIDTGTSNNSLYVNQSKPNGSSRVNNYDNESTYLPSINTKFADSPASQKRNDPNYVRPDDRTTIAPSTYSTSDKDRRINAVQPPSANGSEGLLGLHMSAAEYRAKLRQQNAHKRDPRHKNMSMKEKHDFIDRL